MSSERENAINKRLKRAIREELDDAVAANEISRESRDELYGLAIELDRTQRRATALEENRRVAHRQMAVYKELAGELSSNLDVLNTSVQHLGSSLREHSSYLMKAVQLLDNYQGLDPSTVERFLQQVAVLKVPPTRRLITPFPLGRSISPDRRDKHYPLEAVLYGEVAGYPRPTGPGQPYRYWFPHGWWGDQLQTPQCVGYAWMHWVEDGPITHAPRAWGEGPVVHPAIIYHRAQQIDEWPGEGYAGTSVRAGAKAIKENGLISSFWWAESFQDIIQAIHQVGPVVVGTWWYWDMFYPDERGYVKPTGRSAGGHAYLANGVNLEREIIRFKNSWGKGWGRNGHFYMTFEDFYKLWGDGAEACLALEVTDEDRLAKTA